MYMKKRMARRSRNAAARKSLSQNMIDVGGRTIGVEGAYPAPGQQMDGPGTNIAGGAALGQISVERMQANCSYQDAMLSQSSLGGARDRSGNGVVMQYQNMLIGDQSAGHLTQLTSSNYSKSFRRHTNQTAGKESQMGKSAFTNPSGRENVVDTTQNDEPNSSYRQSCNTALRNFSNADLSAKTMQRKGRLGA